MLDSLIERLRNAIEDGEVLTIIYQGGHHPGAKRRVLPLRIAGHLLYARNSVSMAVKTYCLDSVLVVPDDYAAPWAEESPLIRQRAIRVEPVTYFASWAYKIEKAHWPALGVSLREYVDKEKSAELRRSLATEDQSTGKGSLATVKVLAYAVSNPPVFDFHEGDLFYPNEPELPMVQVIARRKLIEVHQLSVGPSGYRFAYQLVDFELADWLREGTVPRHALIDAAQSYSDVLRFSIGIH